MDQYDVDLLVIGAGPGGYVASIRAAQLGLSVAIVERDKPGGVCLNVGCIPSKSLIHQADIYHSMKGLAAMGIQCDVSGFDYQKVHSLSRKAADRLSNGVLSLFKKNHIRLIAGEARITGPHQLTLKDGTVLTGKHLLIATGSRPRVLPGWEFDEDRILSSTGALMLQKLPKRLLIVGSGAIGVEFAHIMNAFGVEVTLIEMLDRILPIEDKEVVAVLHQSFKKRGIRIFTSTKAVSHEMKDSSIQVVLESADGTQTTLETDKMLISAGRVPNTEGLGLENVGIELDAGGYVPVGDWYQTSSEHIYAIGDIVRSPQLAHVASKEGEIAVSHMAGIPSPRKLDPYRIPGATYSVPELASFGPTEDKLEEAGTPYKKSVFPFVASGKAVASEHTEGMVKILTNKETGEILACHMVGHQVTELLHETLLAAQAELLAEDVADMVHAHPTLSEAVMEAFRGLDGHMVHI